MSWHNIIIQGYKRSGGVVKDESALEADGSPPLRRRGGRDIKKNAAKHPLKGADGVVVSSHRLLVRFWIIGGLNNHPVCADKGTGLFSLWRSHPLFAKERSPPVRNIILDSSGHRPPLQSVADRLCGARFLFLRNHLDDIFSKKRFFQQLKTAITAALIVIQGQFTARHDNDLGLWLVAPDLMSKLDAVAIGQQQIEQGQFDILTSDCHSCFRRRQRGDQTYPA